MKRSDFLKKLGIGIGVAIVAPNVLAQKEDKSKTTYLDPPDILPIDLSLQLNTPAYIGDIYVLNGVSYIVVSKLAWHDESFKYTLRPLKPGSDIEATDHNLRTNKWIRGGSCYMEK